MTHAGKTEPEGADPGDVASRIASNIYRGFRAYRADYTQISNQARRRFEQADWVNVQQAISRRLTIYHDHVNDVCAANRLLATSDSEVHWPQTKTAYVVLIDNTTDAELAETFFNSVYREHTNDGPTDPSQMFLQRSQARLLRPQEDIMRSYRPSQGLVAMVQQVIGDFDFELPWRNLLQDVGNVLRSLSEARKEITSTKNLTVRVFRWPFYRNKGAYLIGELVHHEQSWPLALPILRTSSGELYVDTLICDEDELSVMFSFTRAYFMVDTSYPASLVDFLQSLLPNKKRSELYASIGLHKHGKTEFYRGFLAHLAESEDQFIIAPGIKGMVMAVFTLPSYQTVFKVIKDRFAPQKNITREEVRAKYHVVKTHDRVGRMADTQEFENFSFPKERFSEDLLAELTAVCRSSVTERGDEIIIRHLYTERQMTPLNLYIEDCSDVELLEALDEYGNAITQLAAANIFPGDMLLKNFGITRHGRVVFYDYDEISYLTDMNFRDLPEPRTEEEALAAEPWYAVGPHDVFPEEFRRFLFGKRRIKELFTRMHGNLFESAYWRQLQSNIEQGEYSDVFPYRRKKRFGQN